MPHEERNDALKRKNKAAVQRYVFAKNQLQDGKKEKLIGDFGCGMGYGVEMLMGISSNVIGIDNSEEAITYAKNNYNGNFLIGDLENEEIPGGFDAIVCLEVLCHLKNPKEFVKNIYGKASELVISSPIDPNPKDGYKWRLHNLSKEEFEGMLKDAGWKIVNEYKQKSNGRIKYLTIHAKKI